MRIPAFNPTGVLAPLGEFARAVRAVLSNGWTIADQSYGEIKHVRWQGVALSVSTRLITKPLSVVLLEAHAVETPDESTSGLPVTWMWDAKSTPAQVRISDIGITGTDPIDVTLWIVGG